MASKSKIIPDSVTKVPKMPEKLVIFRVENSKFWWTRVYLNGRMFVKSTGIVDERNNQRLAFEFAKTFYNDCLLDQRPNPRPMKRPLNSPFWPLPWLKQSEPPPRKVFIRMT
jgi:hypothetical protein